MPRDVACEKYSPRLQDENKGKKEGRRPEMQIYRPGMGLKKRSVERDDKVCNKDKETLTNNTNVSNSDIDGKVVKPKEKSDGIKRTEKVNEPYKTHSEKYAENRMDTIVTNKNRNCYSGNSIGKKYEPTQSECSKKSYSSNRYTPGKTIKKHDSSSYSDSEARSKPTSKRYSKLEHRKKRTWIDIPPQSAVPTSSNTVKPVSSSSLGTDSVFSDSCTSDTTQSHHSENFFSSKDELKIKGDRQVNKLAETEQNIQSKTSKYSYNPNYREYRKHSSSTTNKNSAYKKSDSFSDDDKVQILNKKESRTIKTSDSIPTKDSVSKINIINTEASVKASAGDNALNQDKDEIGTLQSAFSNLNVSNKILNKPDIDKTCKTKFNSNEPPCEGKHMNGHFNSGLKNSRSVEKSSSGLSDQSDSEIVNNKLLKQANVVKEKNIINENMSKPKALYRKEEYNKSSSELTPLKTYNKEEIFSFRPNKSMPNSETRKQEEVRTPRYRNSGIIRIPTEPKTKEVCPPSPISGRLHPERKVPQMENTLVVQKQLFDPNNPDKPVIITFPQPSFPYSGPPSPANPYMCDPGLALPIPTKGLGWQSASYSPNTSGSNTEHVLHQEGQRRLKPIVEKNLLDIFILEKDMNSLISKGITHIDYRALAQCRWKLQLRCENIILADPRYCAEHNLEQYLWKIAYYQVIETLRRRVDDSANYKEEGNSIIISLVDEGIIFFENLLEKQQETFSFNLAQFIDSDSVRPQGLPDIVRVALISVQKILIYLGDLARYREQAAGTSNYGKARNWYLKAQMIAPKNGRPYNQLAIIALLAKRKLDAVYYYIRSLAASNPFLSARESLLSLFEETRKKYEQQEKEYSEGTAPKKSEKSKQQNRSSLADKKDAEEERLEIWIHSDGTSSQNPTKINAGNKPETHELSTTELNKKFLLSFLHVHGKLFTKVGMESFTKITNQMLHEFHVLLQRSPFPLGAARLLQLMAINMFAVINTSLKDQELNPLCRSLLQEQSLQVTLAMASQLLERATSIINDHLAHIDSTTVLMNEDLAQILPVIKTWTDWMACQEHLWSPPPVAGDFKTGCKGDVWTLFADLLTVLRKIELLSVKWTQEKKDGFEPILLTEDRSLAGFLPLLEALQEPKYMESPVDKELARQSIRVMSIQFFGDYLCGISSPYIEFDVENKKFISLVMMPESGDIPEIGQDVPCDSSDDDAKIENDFIEDNDDSEKSEKISLSQEEKEIQKLWSRKEALKKEKDEQDHHRAQIQAVLQETRHKRPTVLEIRPRYLIPDTNCFIDHLEKIKNLLTSGKFHVVVPLVVINELDGLALGCRDDLSLSPDHHTRIVGQVAKDAILFLEEKFATRDPHLRAITSKGSVMDTISFRSEDITNNKGTNDDLILSCCLHYCKDRAEQFMPHEPGAGIRLYREAVLVTEDRNLRVKALTHNVPVRDLPSFLSWAKIR